MKSLCILLLCVVSTALCQEELADIKEELKVTKGHKLDTLNLLIYVALLILVVVTIWMFKHRRFRFVHETGLAIIYGMVIGAIITYTEKPEEVLTENVWLPNNSVFNHSAPPDQVELHIPFVDNGRCAEHELSLRVLCPMTKCEIKQATGYSKEKLFVYTSMEEFSKAQEKSLQKKATFDPEVFFNVLLPPIIFNAGYSMKRKHFFKNFGAIITFAFLGTTISCAGVGAVTYGLSLLRPSMGMKPTDCLQFGAMISATDPVTILAIFNDLNVDVDLYALVFGESVLNDAVAIVLSGAIDKYESDSNGFDGKAVWKAVLNFAGVFFGAFALGSGMGCVTALLTKYTHIRDYPLLETSLFFLMSYGTFLAAEASDMTGIVAVLFCGICQAHYTYNNLSRESQARTKELFELVNFLMENFVFAYIGVSIFTYREHMMWDAVFIPSSFLGIIVGRALNVYPLSFLLNLGRSNKIHYNFQHMMMFSGLRGAIAYALAMRNLETDQRKYIFSTTLLIVITTVILCGGFTTQMLQWLKIRVGVEEDTELQNFQPVRSPRRYQSMEDEPSTINPQNASPTDTAPPTEASSGPSGRLAEKALLVRVWYMIDASFVKPLLTHARPPLTETMPSWCGCLARCLTTEQQLMTTDGGHHGDDSDTDLILDDQDLSYSGGEGGGAEGKANGSSNQDLTDISLHV